MSAVAMLQAALLEALRARVDFGEILNGVFAGPPVKATPPYAELGETLIGDWGTKDSRGYELRPVILIRDATEAPDRLHDLLAAAEAAMAMLPRDLDDWRIASVLLVRQRVVRAAGAWQASAEYRVRMMEA